MSDHPNKSYSDNFLDDKASPPNHPVADVGLRHDWSREEIAALMSLPFSDLLYRAHSEHRAHWDPNRVQQSALLSIKTGRCPEDCAYCPQSARHQADLETQPLIDIDEALKHARALKAEGATRFCMGAAWRQPHDRDMPHLLELVKSVRALGLESCMTLGMLSKQQAQLLAEAGLDYYNHNLDTSPEFYGEIITTRTYAERLETLENVRQAGMKVCCGGILGMGESRADRVGLLQTLANLPAHPESVPINMLVAVPGTPLQDQAPLDELEFIRVLACARILMPRSWLRLSAGRRQMTSAVQAWAFFAGANSIFYGEKLLTTDNSAVVDDQRLFESLGLKPASAQDAPLDAH